VVLHSSLLLLFVVLVVVVVLLLAVPVVLQNCPIPSGPAFCSNDRYVLKSGLEYRIVSIDGTDAALRRIGRRWMVWYNSSVAVQKTWLFGLHENTGSCGRRKTPNPPKSGDNNNCTSNIMVRATSETIALLLTLTLSVGHKCVRSVTVYITSTSTSPCVSFFECSCLKLVRRCL
jgi:hypothetical protein